LQTSLRGRKSVTPQWANIVIWSSTGRRSHGEDVGIGGTLATLMMISALTRSCSNIQRATYTDREEEDGNTLCLDVVRFSFSAFFLRLEARALFTWAESRCIRELIIK
jgi:hypothetical protein